jgi:hypothetical protein
MELDAKEEGIEWATNKLLENIQITQELVFQEPLIFEEDYITLYHVDLNRESKKLLIEKVNLKKKRVVEKWNFEIDIHGIKPSKVMKFHKATIESLNPSFNEIEVENEILK